MMHHHGVYGGETDTSKALAIVRICKQQSKQISKAKKMFLNAAD